MMTVPRLHGAALARVALSIDDDDAALAVRRSLTARGLTCQIATPREAIDTGVAVIALAPSTPPTPQTAAELGPVCRASAVAGHPVVLLAAFPRVSGQRGRERTAALAYLRCHGAVVCADPDVWLETIALLACYGAPAGPAVAIVAAPGSLLAASAVSLANDAAAGGHRFPGVTADAGSMQPADVALVDRSLLDAATPDRVGRALVVPVIGRSDTADGSDIAGEPSDGRVPLIGLRAAIGAAAAAGDHGARLAAGRGPADGPSDIEVDTERLERQLERVSNIAGDHETKVMLAAYGIPITRQAVATTPSAASRLAKRAGYPVEMKPWGPDVPTERDGCPVERGITTAAEVRRAYGSLSKQIGDAAGMIVRETPADGRAVWAEIAPIGRIGLMVVAEVEGGLDPLAAVAPLRRFDAMSIARHLAATRQTDDPPDLDALADILVRASYFVADHAASIKSLELGHITVAPAGQKTCVVDARAVLK